MLVSRTTLEVDLWRIAKHWKHPIEGYTLRSRGALANLCPDIGTHLPDSVTLLPAG